jgi:hypothetical protein
VDSDWEGYFFFFFFEGGFGGQILHCHLENLVSILSGTKCICIINIIDEGGVATTAAACWLPLLYFIPILD